jgi:4-carboxymuconolactone decarboxylase
MTIPSPRISRLPALDNPEADPAIAALFNDLRSSGAKVLNVHRTLAHAPHVFKGWMGLSRSLRHGSTLDRRLCELAIMRQSQLMDSDYEWYIHRQMCRYVGVPDEKIDQLANWKDSGVYSDLEKLVLRYTEQVAAGKGISDPLFAEISAQFTTPELIELTATVAYFIGTTFLLKALDVQIGEEEGKLNPG